MTICRFFLEGRCRYGSSCRDEHVGNGNNQRYNQQRNDSNLIDRIGYSKNQSGPGTQMHNKFYDERTVRMDLTKDRPLYRYSVYGPIKDEPNLIDETDYSPEELRLQYYSIMGMHGNDMLYQNGVKDLENRMQMKVDTVLKDLRSALSTFESKKQQSSGFGSFGSGNAFGQQQQPPPLQQQQQQQTFGVPQNTFGHTPSAFGSNPPNAFGSNPPNAFGSNTQSAFGSSTLGGFGSNPPNAFNVNPPNAFGNSNIPNAFGGGTNTANPFSSNQPPNAFNTNPPNAFNASPPNAFGSNQPSGFGSNSIGFPQPSLQFGAPTFGGTSLENNQSGFGSTTPATAFGGGVFGQPSLTDQQQQQQLFQQQQQQQDLFTPQQPDTTNDPNLWSRENLNLYKMPEEAPPFIFKR